MNVKHSEQPLHSVLTVDAAVTGGKGQLFGGCLVGAAAGLLEGATGRPTVWITTQFAAPAADEDRIELAGEIRAAGRSVTQGVVMGTIDGRHHSTSLVALGARSFEYQTPLRPMPPVPPPEDCGTLDFDAGHGGLRRRVDLRCADPEPDEQRTTTRLWLSFPGTPSGDTYSLAIAADFFPPALAAAVGQRVFGASLDNTVRYLDRAECEWLLVEMNVEAIRTGIGHGTNYVWSQSGDLLAVASQTCALSGFDA